MADHVDSAFFEPEAWQRRNALLGTARGRGAAVFVQGKGGEYVLRHYRRGGLPARLSEDCYFWLGLEHSRPWLEWHMLVTLQAHNLPAPRPIAARLVQTALCYRADIVTARIPGQSLASLLARTAVGPESWRAIGACVRQFHEAGVYHADLNAHNILLNDEGAVFLVDFDRGRFRPPGDWQKGNLDRLQRSLRKLVSLDVRFAFNESDWDDLMLGYR